MRARNASPSVTRRRYLPAVALALVLATVTGCYSNPDPTDWGAAAKKNFVEGCTTEVAAEGGTTTTSVIQDKSTCECIYDKMVDEYNLSWEDMKDYESKQAGAKAGDEPPTPPSALTKAIDACRPEGPRL